VLSGLLRDRHEVRVEDAMAVRERSDHLLSRIRKYGPDVIISLASSASWNEDSVFFQKTRNYSNAPILLSGDYPRAAPGRILDENDAVHGVVMDFTDCDVASFADGKRGSLRNIHTRDGEVIKPNVESDFTYPIPQHELFPLRRYHHPLISCHPYTTVITDFGCPYKCTFCPYERIQYKTRDMDNVEEELRHIHSLGIREILFNDASFGAGRTRTARLCKILSGFRPGFRWICDMRVDHAKADLLEMMKAAGCELVMLGVETPTDGVLQKTRKEITTEQAVEAFRCARTLGVRTLAHFILGLDGESWDSQVRLIDFALELDPDYVSFGLAVPAWDTTFRDRLVNMGRIDPESTGFDVSGTRPLWESEGLSKKHVAELRRLAIRRFYFRPSYLLRRMTSIRTAYEARNLVVQGMHLLLDRGD